MLFCAVKSDKRSGQIYETSTRQVDKDILYYIHIATNLVFIASSDLRR